MRLAFLGLFHLLAVVASATDFTYTNNSGRITITGYTGPGGEVVIPDSIDGLPVTAIGTSAFNRNYDLTGVTLPDSLTVIEANAFRECTGLTSVTVPGGVTLIRESAFRGCSGITSVTIDYGVRVIWAYSFSGCTSLESVQIPASVTLIGRHAFSSCTSLSSVTIPANVTTIVSTAFYDCPRLTSIDVAGDNTAYSSMDGVLFSKDQTELLQVPSARVGDYPIPVGVTNIANHAFYKCTGLTDVTIPAGVTRIGGSAFYGCTGLTTMTLPSGVTRIEELAFERCTGLTDVIIPSTVTHIGHYAFYSCTALTEVTIPYGVGTIEFSAFAVCTSLTRVTIPASVTSIEPYAFRNCRSLTRVAIPNSVTSIGSDAFSGCTNLAEVTIGDSVARIGDYAFYQCASLRDVEIPTSMASIGNNAFQECTGLVSIAIPDSVTSIGNDAFSGCTALTNVAIGDGVTSIGHSAFRGCTALSMAAIGAGVTHIGDSAFRDCVALTDVTIPASVANIGSFTFQSCTALASVTIAEGVAGIGSYAFHDCVHLTSVTIPASLTHIGSYAFRGCTSLTAITVADANPAYSSAEGVLFRDHDSTLVQFPAAKPGDYAVPDGVSNVEAYAFYSCTGLTALTFPASVTNIGSYALFRCPGLSSITVADANPTYSSLEGVMYSKDQCTLLQFPVARAGDYDMPAGVTSIGEYAFRGCPGLTSITVAEANPVFSSAGGVLFNKDRTLLIQYPGGRVGGYVMPAGVSTIGTYAFYRCTGLTSLTIPADLTEIEGRAFEDCTGLRGAYFLGNAPVYDTRRPAFFGASHVIVYRVAEATGWPPVGGLWAERGTAIWDGTMEVGVPVFNPDGGAYPSGSVQVTVTCSTAGAMIHFTTDGDDPAMTSPTVDDGSVVVVPVPGTLRARAFMDGWMPGAEAVALYVEGTAGGIPFAWLHEHNLPTDGSVDHVRMAGSLFTVREEWLAGTNPNDPSDNLAMTAPPELTLAGFKVRWRSVSTRTYAIERSPSLLQNQPFQVLAVDLPGIDGISEYMDDSAQGHGPYFFRVRVVAQGQLGSPDVP